MPEFVDPFKGLVERKLTREELIRAIRLDIVAEHEATYLYMAHAEAVDDPLAKAVLIDIANEEREHIGEFMRVLSILTAGEEDQWLASGVAEVDQIASSLSATPATVDQAVAQAPAVEEGQASTPAGMPAGGEPTLGSLRP